MKEVKSLDELEALIGKEAVEHCFMEYMMLIIAKARGWDKLYGGGDVGDKDIHDRNAPVVR